MTLWEQIVHVSSYTIGVRRAVMIVFTHHHHPCKPAGVAKQFTTWCTRELMLLHIYVHVCTGKLYYGKHHLGYMQCSYANTNEYAECQLVTTVQTYMYNIATGISVHTQYMFCGTIVVSCVDFQLHNVATCVNRNLDVLMNTD